MQESTNAALEHEGGRKRNPRQATERWTYRHGRMRKGNRGCMACARVRIFHLYDDIGWNSNQPTNQTNTRRVPNRERRIARLVVRFSFVSAASLARGIHSIKHLPRIFHKCTIVLLHTKRVSRNHTIHVSPKPINVSFSPTLEIGHHLEDYKS